jgi:hypothetical protein
MFNLKKGEFLLKSGILYRNLKTSVNEEILKALSKEKRNKDLNSIYVGGRGKGFITN